MSLVSPSTPVPPVDGAPLDAPGRQRWPWWPLLPLYPYGRRRTLVRELIPGRIWSFEQLQGVWYVAVPIRMTVVRLQDGLLLYAPVAPTREVIEQLGSLEGRYGPVRSIVLPTASGLEHKVPVPAMARAFPEATVWVTPHQWSFPLRLPSRWLGFPAQRTRVLFEDGVPHQDQLDWRALGPLELGLGTFMEATCLDRCSGSLLVTDALVSIPGTPPELFELDPTPLLFHGRDRGDEPLSDTPARRNIGWKRIVLFASYLRPRTLEVPPLAEILRHSFAPCCRQARSHFGLYPFRWQPGWQQEFDQLVGSDRQAGQPKLPTVLERLVFPRQRQAVSAWLRSLCQWREIRWLVPAHFDAPISITADRLHELAEEVEARPWASDDGSWATLAGIDRTLLKFGLVPSDPSPSS